MLTSRLDAKKEADAILDLIKAEGIATDNQSLQAKQFGKIRRVTNFIAQSAGVIAPGMTSCVANTLLKVGLCNELSQLFALEYCLNYKKQDVCIVFTCNPDLGDRNTDHAFVIIGKINAPNNLFVGRGDGDSLVTSPKKINQSLITFLTNNKESVIADPLLNCSGNLDAGLSPLLDYFKTYNITHVMAIKSYHATPLFIENAGLVKQNAKMIAEQTKFSMSLAGAKISGSKVTTFQQPQANVILPSKKINITTLVAKYKLPDDSQPSLEKGLRVAATNNHVEDLKFFISMVKNINAQDANPKVKRTALHWAAIKGHDECYQLLLAAGAKTDILDFEEKMAGQYKTSSIKNKK